VSAADEVLAAARVRAGALAAADAEVLTELLHPDFTWISHTGARLDRAAYVERNTGGTTVWRSQTLTDARVTVVGEAAVLTAVAEDVVRVGADWASFRMPMTAVWVREDRRWRCLAGHAGPRLD